MNTFLLDTLPLDIKRLIGNFLGIGDIICLRHTSKAFICLEVESFYERDHIIKDLIKYNRLDLLDSLQYKLDYSMITTAIKTNALNIVKQIICNNYTKTQGDKFNDASLCTLAANLGHFDCLKFLYENNYVISNLTLNGAIEIGNIDIVKWLINDCKLSIYDEHIVNAVKFGKLNMLKYLLRFDIDMIINICKVAIQHKQFEILEWLISNSYLKDKREILSFIDHVNWLTDDEKTKIINIIDSKYNKN